MTKLEIINETVNFYSEDISRRSRVDRRCLYNSGDSRHCALGRCFLPEYKEQGLNFKMNNDSADDLCIKYDGLDNLLLEQYRGHSTSFWGDLQELHDNNDYWNEHGINNYGMARVEELKELYTDTEADEIRELAKRFGVCESQIKIIKEK